MANDLERFISAVKSDASLAAKVAGATGDELINIANEAGFAIDAQSLQTLAKAPTGDLTDAELNAVAGGGHTFICINQTNNFEPR